MSIIFIGFDSAWADNPKALGAICSIEFNSKSFLDFRPPCLVDFNIAGQIIENVHRSGGLTLIAIDQPTIVRNQSGMRPAEKVAGSVVGFIGGGVQPANKDRTDMFGMKAPIWKFLRKIRATQDPKKSRQAKRGKFIMEVFPALALPAFNQSFFASGRGPKYNPRGSRFSQRDWKAVAATGATIALQLKMKKLAAWFAAQRNLRTVKKSDQDKLDAAICLLIAVYWHRAKRESSVMIGDLKSGYIVAPVTPKIKQRLSKKAVKEGVELDGVVPAR